VLGALHGVRGVRDGNFVDLTAVPERELLRIAATPSATLGSTRDKPDAAYCEKVLAGLKRAGADAFVYIGGNDTAGTQAILAEAAGGSIAMVHAPKTIDNDLVENDHTPVFISAGEFVAAAFLSVDLDFRALPGIYVGIVMGRHAGFLTAAAAAWRIDDGSGPHLVYVPERPFNRERFVDDVRGAMSEGVVDTYGRPLVESLVPQEMLERDAHGNIRLSGGDLGQAVERMLSEGLPGKRARVDTLGYLPRGAIALMSTIDQREAFRCGEFAVEAAARGGGSVAVTMDGDRMAPSLVPLAAVAGKTRHMPDDFLMADENRLAPAGLAYLERLLPRKFDPAKPFV
jgi:6-phosphofructokinase 1